jgi:leucyl-tRNA synthetase
LERIWRAGSVIASSASRRTSNPGIKTDVKLARLLNKTIEKVGKDIEGMNFNTAISAMMIFANELGEKPAITAGDWQKFYKMPNEAHIFGPLQEELDGDLPKTLILESR